MNFDRLDHIIRTSSGWRRRRAWRRLVEAGDGGDVAAIQAMWRVWLLTRDVDAWEFLLRWRNLPDLLTDIYQVVFRPERPKDLRKAVVDFCVEHGVVPDEPVYHVLFQVLAGRTDQVEALDPDGSMLATGYRHVHPVIQAELRKAMVDVGSVGLARLVADQRDLEVSETDVDFVLTRLAEEQDWPRLWRMARTLRLDQTVRAVHQIRGWRPSDEAGQDVFDLLTAADPRFVSTVVDGAFARIDTHDYWFSDPNLSIAPDASEMAMIIRPEVAVFALPSGRKLRSFELIRDGALAYAGGGGIVHIGDAVVYVEAMERIVRHRRPDWRKEYVWPHRPDGIFQTSEGFVANVDRELGFGTADSESLRLVNAARFGLRGALRAEATDPGSGRIAITAPIDDRSGYLHLFVVDKDLNVLGRSRTYHGGNATFLSKDRLINTDATGHTTLWRVSDGKLVVDGRKVFSGNVTCPVPGGPLSVVSRGKPEVEWVDQVTLEPAEAPPAAGNTPLHTLPDGVHALFHRENSVEIRDLRLDDAAEVLSLPLSAIDPSKMSIVDATIERSDMDVKPVLELLRACLEYRFGADIALGTVREALGDDDIALGGT